MTESQEFKKEPISRHFTWHEALWLPSYCRYAVEADGLTDEIKANLKILFAKLDLVRDFLDHPIIILCAYRPKPYNQLVKGAADSPHLHGCAVDFHTDELTADEIRAHILHENKLDLWDLRMENLGDRADRGWVHLDTIKPPFGHSRYFKP